MDVLNVPSEKRWVWCIVAHIDHGKTTFCDSLLVEKKIITRRNTGIRYLDNREDEQERGITIESTVVSFYHEEKVITFVDSPGHVDFSSQISSVIPLCDGCLVLVDIVEGMCIQTKTVLFQIWKEKLKPLLVINKIDRLVNELNLTTEEAFSKFESLIIEINTFYATLEVEDGFNEDNFFSPEKGNVIFCSGKDGWAFTIDTASLEIEKRLDCKIRPFIWGDYYFCQTSKKIFGKKEARKRGLSKRVFSQFVLDGIWVVYKKEEKTKEMLAMWHPLAQTVFSETIKQLPTTKEGNEKRLSLLTEKAEGNVVYLSKICFIKNVRCVKTCFGKEGAGVLIGFARILKGKIFEGQKMYFSNNKEEIILKKLFCLEGRELYSVPFVSEGTVFGLYIENELCLRKGFLHDEVLVLKPSFNEEKEEAFISVVIEAVDFKKNNLVISGLKMLCCVDPSAKYEITPEGENVLKVCGDLHLKKCLWDLENLFLKEEIVVSDPIVPFRETVSEEESFFITEKHEGILIVIGVFKGENETENILCTSGTNKLIFKSEETALRNILITGFKNIVKGGVLCGEELTDVCFIVSKTETDFNVEVNKNHIPFINSVFRKVLSKQKCRLLFSFYLGKINVTKNNMKRLRGILSKRRGRIKTEEYFERTKIVIVTVEIPIVKCFGISDELRSKCHGEVFPVFSFLGFFVEDEDVEKEYINFLRKKKGMFVFLK